MELNSTPMYCEEKFISSYLSAKKDEFKIPFEVIAKKSQSSEETVKNIFTGKTANPGLLTVAPMTYAVNGSLDEMCLGKPLNENPNAQTIEFYKQQIVTMQEQHEKHNDETRAHYEQHRQDYKDHTEHRLADKREIIEQQQEHIMTLKKELLTSKIFTGVCIAVLVGLLIAEVMNPNLGWIQF